MRILTTSAYTPEGETGSAQVAKRLSHKLSEKHQVMYLCLGKDLRVVKINKNLWYLTIPSTNINDVWIPNINSLVTEKITKELDKFSPDVVHAHNIIYGGLISLIWATERNVPYVLTFHYIPSEGVAYIFPKLQNNKVISTINYHLTANYINNFIKHTSLIIALNQPIVNSLKKLNVATPYKIINNGLDLKKFYQLKIIPPKDKIYFIYVGSYIGRKNQEYLLEAFSHLPSNYILNMFGNKTSGSMYVQKLQNIISKKNITNVFINDFFERNKLLQEYEKSHYLVSASLKEVQSMVYVESLAAGHPVIALKNETVDEIINSKNGLVLSKKTDPKTFARKLTEYVKQTNKNYINTSAICRVSISQFDFDAVVSRLVNAYEYAIEINKSEPLVTETKLYQTLRDVVPKPILSIIPDSLKMQLKPNISPLKRTLVYTFLLGLVARLISKVIVAFKKISQLAVGTN